MLETNVHTAALTRHRKMANKPTRIFAMDYALNDQGSGNDLLGVAQRSKLAGGNQLGAISTASM
jgi:hypothetical protein